MLDQVEKVGGRIVFVQDGLDTSATQARLVLALLSEVARSESAKHERTAIASRQETYASLGHVDGGRAAVRATPGRPTSA